MKHINIYMACLTAASTDGEYQWTESFKEEEHKAEGTPEAALRDYVEHTIAVCEDAAQLAITEDYNGCIHNLPDGAIVVTMNETPAWIFWAEADAVRPGLERVALYGMDEEADYDPKKVRPAIILETDVYDKAVITEGDTPYLIGFDESLNEWVCLGRPDQLGWEWVAPDPDDADSIAQAIRASDTWQLDLDDRSPERMLCKLAGMEQELEDADDEEFESVIEAAADKLGVEIY